MITLQIVIMWGCLREGGVRGGGSSFLSTHLNPSIVNPSFYSLQTLAEFCPFELIQLALLRLSEVTIRFMQWIAKVLKQAYIYW